MKIEIHKTKNCFDGMYFVCQARAKDATRHVLQCVSVTQDCIVATDGHRLHILDYQNNYTPGLYDVLVCSKSKIVLLKSEEQGKFPAWQDIIPEHKDSFNVDGTLPLFIERILVKLGKQDICVNLEYLKPLKALKLSWHVYFGKPNEPVLLSALDHGFVIQAVIMPFNL